MGAPGDFPVLERNRRLQKYLQWSDEIDKISNEFIKNVLPEGPFVGIHLRTGSDWVMKMFGLLKLSTKTTLVIFCSPFRKMPAII